ncbi:hypothetical protein PG996_010006 [Apiospora saccharicola]|uniref:2EXR domain-containing protein n=1 Tax=Apiospora saccharicola TaxID=335842 RepID=A0ABR1UMD4_9PEZI
MLFKKGFTFFSCRLKVAPAREQPKTRRQQGEPPRGRNATPSPQIITEKGTGRLCAATRPTLPPSHDASPIREKGPPERVATDGGGDANEEAPPDKAPRTFPKFTKLPPELRMMIWHMAAEKHKLEIELNQRCFCNRKPGGLHFFADRAGAPLRGRLALLHACRESRALLAPRYDAFEYAEGGMVEAPGDLHLQPSPACPRIKPELTWTMDHRFVPFSPMPWHYRHPHMLVDCQEDIFNGMLTWEVSGRRVPKCYVKECLFERPERPQPLDSRVQCARQRVSRDNIAMIEIPPPEELTSDGAPFVVEVRP